MRIMYNVMICIFLFIVYVTNAWEAEEGGAHDDLMHVSCAVGSPVPTLRMDLDSVVGTRIEASAAMQTMTYSTPRSSVTSLPLPYGAKG